MSKSNKNAVQREIGPIRRKRHEPRDCLLLNSQPIGIAIAIGSETRGWGRGVGDAMRTTGREARRGDDKREKETQQDQINSGQALIGFNRAAIGESGAQPFFSAASLSQKKTPHKRRYTRIPHVNANSSLRGNVTQSKKVGRSPRRTETKKEETPTYTLIHSFSNTTMVYFR